MGHFIYQNEVSDIAEQKIDDALQRLVDNIDTPLEEEETTLCRDLIGSWTEEIFCDLFAISLIGPASSFAFSQLVGASMLIGRPPGEPADFYSFESDHPAEVSRFYYHRKVLERLGWWEVIKDWSSPPVEVLRICSDSTSLFAVEVGGALRTVPQDRLLFCFDEVCDWLVKYVPSKVKRRTDEVADFKVQAPIIADYLRRAIVPSTVMIGKDAVYPSPVVLINAGYRFLLEELSLLLENIEDESPNSIESRSKFSARLELWLLKALEDHRLLTGGNPDHGSPTQSKNQKTT
jgi:hypothetical protein